MDPFQTPPPPNFSQNPKFDIFFEAFPNLMFIIPHCLDKHKCKKKSVFGPGKICLTRCGAWPGSSLICLIKSLVYYQLCWLPEWIKYELSKILDLMDLNFSTSTNTHHQIFFNPNPVGVSESLIRRGGSQMARGWKLAILAIFLHSKHQESYQGTLGTQELPPTGSMTSHGPSLGLTGSLKRT